MKLYFFTYSLNEIAPLFAEGKDDKNEILKGIIKQKMKIFSGKSKYVYFCHKNNGNWIHAEFGKKEAITTSRPGKTKFVSKNDTTYPNCNMFFNCDGSKSGQKIAFEHKSETFGIKAALKVLEQHINTILFNSGYAMSIHPIMNKAEFWEIVKKHEGRIQKLTFSYAAPNLFKIKNDLSDELKAVQKKYGATNSSITLENKNGKLIVPEKDELINQSSDYVTKGGGEFKLKVKNMKGQITSKGVVKTLNIEEAELSTQDGDAFNRIMKEIFNLKE